MSRIKVEVVPVTQFVQNCSIIYPDGGGPAVLVDPGGDLGTILDVAERVGARIESILVTHGHIDHVGALPEAAEATGAPVWLHPDDLWLYERPPFGMPPITVPADTTHIADGDVVETAGMRFRVLHTPGHSPGHVCFWVEEGVRGSSTADAVRSSGTAGPEPLLIGGDLIFFGSIGRTDLPGGDLRTLVRSVQEKIWVLPDETNILPGHGPATTVGFEKQTNPFVSLIAIEDLVR
jgi:hydroxyacylglutathione hydrolase